MSKSVKNGSETKTGEHPAAASEEEKGGSHHWQCNG